MLLRELGNWPRIVAVGAWLRDHPDSGLYIRQFPIAGVDTKFPDPCRRPPFDIGCLSSGEADVFGQLSRDGLRLEQERILMAYAEERIACLT
ncbi:DUF3322 domain-containing protein [Haloferula sargassicola]|uniref:DUF3322 domain-containing protein n=1 Tax=Haloferula sargassicola TaxID=490096 RepID=A0ABP9UKS1_9BACT